MELKLLNISDDTSTTDFVKVDELVFSKKYNEGLIHQIVSAYASGARQGTACQKTRAEVRGGGTKPWRQKGTGRARAGTIRSPLWKGGGVVHAAKNRDYTQKVNKKMYNGAMCSILSELLRLERLILVRDIISDGKTRNLVKQLDLLQLKSVLIITEQKNHNLFLSARNLPKIDTCIVDKINPIVLLSFENILVTLPALKKIEERFGEKK